jgi:hypothetical protein
MSQGHGELDVYFFDPDFDFDFDPDSDLDEDAN